MKNLNFIFDLFSLKKKWGGFILAFFLSFVLLPLSLQAVTLDPTGTCDGTNYDVAAGANTIDGDTVGDPNYYQLTLPSSGVLTITLTTDNKKPATFFIGTACDGIDIYNGDSDSSSHSHTFRQYSSNPVYLKIANTNPNESFTITIDFTATSVPIMGDIPDQVATNGSPYNLDIATYVTETDGDPIISYTLTPLALPTGLSFNTSTGLLSGTPTENGTFDLSVYATDIDGNSNTDTFTLTVAPETPPIMGDIPDQTAVVNVDPINLDIATYVTETDGDPILSYTLSGALPTGLTFNTATGLLSGTPAQSDTFNLSAYATDNDGNSNTDTFTLTVGDTAPVAVDDDANTSKNISVTIDILGNDIGGGTPVPNTVTITSNPNSGTVSVNTTTGEVTYTPDTDYSGADSFTYTVNNSDGIPSNVATVTITVNAPVAVDDSANTPMNTNIDINVTDNDTSADSTIDITTVTITSNPTVGTVSVNSTTGVVTYIPKTDWFGNDTFTYTVDDANGVTSNEATVTVSVISEQQCHDDAIPLLNATAYGDTNTSTNNAGLTSNDQDIFKIYLDLDGILETNITNSGTEGLYFDFSNNCGRLFESTRFSINPDDPADPDYNGTVSLPIVVNSGWYYISFIGAKSNTATPYSVTVTLLDPFSGGGTGGIGGGDTDIVNMYEIDAYNGGTHYITTKVAGDDPTSITGVHLDEVTGQASIYIDESFNGGNRDPLWFMIIPYWSDGTCSTIDQVVEEAITGKPLVMQITHESSSVTAAIKVPPKAIKDARFKITYLDLGSIYAATGDQCILNSATSGNLQGIGQCINSPAVHYEPNFGTPAYYRCVYGNGQPCLSSYHGYSCGPGETDCPNYNPLYDNEYGCLMCTLGSNETCSKDNFSIRPVSYSMDLNNSTPLLTAGKFYELDANATYIGGGNSPTTGYTIILDNTLATTASHVFDPAPAPSTTTCPPSGPDGNFTMPFSNGEGSASIKYENVGDINITLVDGNWTSVDQNDTHDLECISGSDSITSNPVGCLIKNSLQHRYIPDRFDINATLKDHNNVDNFTYLNDTHTDDSYNAMSALLDVNISAKSLTGTTTSHYVTGCYAQDTNLTLALSDMNITYPGSALPQALTQFLYYNSMEDNGSADSGEGNSTLPTSITVAGTNTIVIPSLTIENSTLTFPVNAADGNGTTYVEYKLNFDRKLNLAVNPFQIELTDLNMIDNDGAEGNQTSITDQNATIYYARTRASQFFYEDITTPTAITPIVIDLYCNLAYTACNNLGINTSLGKTNVSNWWISLNHDGNNTNGGDGNISIKVGSPLIEPEGIDSSDQAINGITYNTTNTGGDAANIIILIGDSGVKHDVNVSRGSNQLPPLTVPLELVKESDVILPAPYTNAWLIHNPDYPIELSPFYKVRFIGDANWTGEGQTGYVMDINASYIKLKRLDW